MARRINLRHQQQKASTVTCIRQINHYIQVIQGRRQTHKIKKDVHWIARLLYILQKKHQRFQI